VSDLVEVLDYQDVDELYFSPNSWAQERAYTSRAHELLYSGHLGSSKTRTACEIGDSYCRSWPGARVAVMRKRRVDLGLTTLRCLLEDVITPSHRAWGWSSGADGASTLFYRNDSEIHAIGFDNPSKLLSSVYDLVLIDQAEECERMQWQGAAGRLRGHAGPYRQIAGFVNPADPSHWMYDYFKPDEGSRCLYSQNDVTLRDGRVIPKGALLKETIVASLMDNLENLPPEYLALIDSYKGIWHDRFVLGKWVAFIGAIYSCFDPNIHVVSRPREWARWEGYPPPDWPIYMGIDFGFQAPFVCQWWAEDPEGNYWLYQEIYMSHRTINVHGRQIIQLNDKQLNAYRDNDAGNSQRDLDFLLNYMNAADHDAGDRAVLEDEFGIVTQPADKKDVSSGLQSVYELMVPRRGVDGRPTSRLKFVRDALVEKDDSLEYEERPTCTFREIPRYRIQDNISTNAEEGPREKPRKRDDHGCDAMRYLFKTLKGANDMKAVRL
jgi:hypothetical protein